MSIRYSQEFRVKVAKEALQPENQGLEHIIAEKYGVRKWTVIKWRDIYKEYGGRGLSKSGMQRLRNKTEREKQLEKENAELREEIEILKKAAAFLADLRRG